MSNKLIIKYSILIVGLLISIDSFSQKKEIGYLTNCNVDNRETDYKIHVYSVGKKFKVCRGGGFILTEKDTIIDGKKSTLSLFTGCDTCDFVCSKESYLYKKRGRYIKVTYFDSTGRKIDKFNLYPLVVNKKIPYPGEFTDLEDKSIFRDSISYLKDSIINDGENKSHPCYVFYCKFSIRHADQKSYFSKIFVDKSILIPIRIEYSNIYGELIRCKTLLQF